MASMMTFLATRRDDVMNKEQVIKKIGKKNWPKFIKFMRGQTYAVNDDGSADYYDYDVENFLKKPEDRFFD